MQSDYPSIPVHPVSLHRGDVMAADPDHLDRPVSWPITSDGYEAGVRVIEYVTEDGTEGRHAFPDPSVLVPVRVPRHDMWSAA